MDLMVRAEPLVAPEESAPPWPGRAAVVMLVLSLLGLVDALYVAHSAATGRTMYCILFDGCNVVTQSPYGRFYGAPLSFLGVIFYLCSLGLSALLAFDPLSRGLRAGALILSGVGVAYSAFSMFLQARYIRAFCSYCLISAIITVLLVSTASWHFARTRKWSARANSVGRAGLRDPNGARASV
jgi:uncharacterized membrane protein